MEKHLLIGVWVILMLWGVCCVRADAKGLLKNAGFDESPAPGQPAGWKIPEGAQDVCQLVDDEGHSGKQCLRFRIEIPQKVEPVAQEFACEPGRDYVLSAWFKAGGGLRPVICVTPPGQRGPALSKIEAARTERWIRQDHRFNSGTNSRLRVSIYADAAAMGAGNAAPGTAWVDDVQVWDAAEFARSEEVARQASGPKSVNIARGKPYTLEPPPNYRYCTDEGDATQLTDGEYSVGYFWVQRGTVGWEKAPYAIITIDLRKVEPICGLSFNTAGGVAGVRWPRLILILTSEDGREFNYAGDLIEMSRKNGLPALAGYGVHRYATRDLRTKGRYVRLVVVSSGRYTFCDEIEIYRGADSLLAGSVEGERVANVKAFVRTRSILSTVREPLVRDIEIVRQSVRGRGVAAKEADVLRSRLSQLHREVKSLKSVPEVRSPAVAPLNALHAEILKVNARALRASGFPPLFAWHKNRWDTLRATEAPEQPPDGPPALTIEMMDNEYRAEVVNLTNTTDSSLNAVVAIEGLPGGRNPDYVMVHQVEVVGTKQGVMIADPLPVAERTADGWAVAIPSGMTRQVWLTFHPRGVPAGEHVGSLVVRSDRLPKLTVPLTLRIYPFRFPDQPRLSLGMWDYTDGPPYHRKCMTPRNVSLAIANMRAHFVDTPWAHRSSACWPEKDDFDAEGNLVKPVRSAGFDKWVEDWKGSRNYYIFLAVGSDFLGEPMGSPRFNKMVKNWAAAFAAHARKIGVSPSQIGLLLVDEPHKPEQYRISTIWAKAVKTGAPEIVLFTDASGLEKPDPELEQMLAVHDVFCPHLPSYRGMDDVKRKLLRPNSARPKNLWFYSCMGPARLLDPYYYHRLQTWHCWRHGAVGMGFWNYWNYYIQPDATPWNEFVTSAVEGKSFGVVYATPDSVTDGKHWEAVREGIEDYEYLRMLRDRIEELKARGVSVPALQQAVDILETVPEEVASEYDMRSVPWSVEKDRSVADRCRVRVLKALDSLKEM